MNELIKFEVEVDSEIKSVSVPLIEYKGVPVVFSGQLATLFEVDPKTITNNFNKNITEFTENEDYFALEYEELSDFKNYIQNSNLDRAPGTCSVDNLSRISKLYLWTEEGVANHAKISNSKNAWKIFKVIKKYYFKNKNSNQLMTLQNQLSSLVQTVGDLTKNVSDLTVLVTNQRPKVLEYDRFLSTNNFYDM
jgi:hypothetical protein